MRARMAIALWALFVVWCQLQGCASTCDYGRAATKLDVSFREHIEWCDTWVTAADKNDLPRVLLIGDSITRGYFKDVENHLEGKAYCARVTTSKSIGDPYLLPEVELMLKQYRFKVIHVNNGLHGPSYTEEQYGKAFGPFMDAMVGQAQGARVIWTSTTPYKDGKERNERVKARNRIAAAYVSEHGLAIDDLFALVVDHPEYYSNDGVHFNKTGVELQARQVADCILKTLAD